MNETTNTPTLSDRAAALTDKVVPGRVTVTRALVLGYAWATYAVMVLPCQWAWFLLQKYAFKNDPAPVTVWKPQFRKMYTVAEAEARAAKAGQPRTITDIIMLFLFGWFYAILRIIRK